MIFFKDLSSFVDIGSISIKWYAVLIMTGAFLAYAISLRNLKKMAYPASMADDLFFGALLFGIIGARLWYVVFYDLQTYLANPISILMTWQGGMAIQGGLVAGGLFAYFFFKRKGISFLRMADAIVPNILIAQAIGRWGNFMNQEAYGRIVDEAYYRFFPSFIKNAMFIGGQYREPTFLYESILNIIGFLLIVFVLKRMKQTKRGDLAYAYLMWYGVVRFFVEIFRSDSLMFMGLKTAQLTSLVFIVIGLLGMLGVYNSWFKTAKPVILFDFDGTIADTEGMIVEAMKATLKQYRPELEITREMEISFLGPTLDQILKRYLTPSEIEGAFKLYREINHDLHKSMIKPMPGALETLYQLKQDGYRLGIVSSKKKSVIEYGLQLLKMDDIFSVIVGYDEVNQHKPSPEGLLKACELLGIDHDNVIYVGDTSTDILAANNAWLYSVALITHPERKEALLKAEPNCVINDLRELNELVKREQVWTKSLT